MRLKCSLPKGFVAVGYFVCGIVSAGNFLLFLAH